MKYQDEFSKVEVHQEEEEEAAKGKIIKVGKQPFWLVDPLDGTKEFIAHRDQFTVNIALIEDFSPTMGVVFAPALRTSYGTDGQGTAVKRVGKNAPKPISARPIPEKDVIVTASRSHGDKNKMQELIKDYAISNVLISGRSIKFCMVASGEADIYPRYGPTSEWDIAAGHAIVKHSGGLVKTLEKKDSLDKEDALTLNKKVKSHKSDVLVLNQMIE